MMHESFSMIYVFRRFFRREIEYFKLKKLRLNVDTQHKTTSCLKFPFSMIIFIPKKSRIQYFSIRRFERLIDSLKY